MKLLLSIFILLFSKSLCAFLKSTNAQKEIIELTHQLLKLKKQIKFQNYTMYNLQNYVMNYLSYNTLLQMRNTLSTDLDFKEDKAANKLYINAAYSDMQEITIEYVPTYHTVEQITSSYWILQLKKLSLALVKIALGRIRTRFGHTGDIITQDGDKILEEGNTEYKEVMQHLTENSMMFIPVD